MEGDTGVEMGVEDFGNRYMPIVLAVENRYVLDTFVLALVVREILHRASIVALA